MDPVDPIAGGTSAQTELANLFADTLMQSTETLISQMQQNNSFVKREFQEEEN